jgi:hypothetical protein
MYYAHGQTSVCEAQQHECGSDSVLCVPREREKESGVCGNNEAARQKWTEQVLGFTFLMPGISILIEAD